MSITYLNNYGGQFFRKIWGGVRKRKAHDVNIDYDKMLFDSVFWGSLDGTLSALHSGANVNAREIDGTVVLMLAAQGGNWTIANILLQAGANINIQNKNGQTALMYATWNWRTETVDKLIQAGADINIQNNEGKTALDMAIEKKYFDIVNLIKSNLDKQIDQQNYLVFDLNI